MKAVLDTNVIISALIVTDSLPNRVLTAGQTTAYDLVLSQPLLIALDKVLRRPRIRTRLSWSDSEINAFMAGLRQSASIVEPEIELHVVRDKADNRVLEAAVAAEADYVVTGDAQPPALAQYQGSQIVTPAHFLTILQTSLP